ncbi:MAG: FxsA family protein, partial [Hyphomicrobium sp.]
MQSPFRLIVSLVLLALPLLEIALLIKAGQAFGFWPVVGTIIVTGFAGARIIQTQGIATFRRISEALDHGREPHRELADGALRLVAGVLLLLPGPMTDTLGALLMVPPLRSLAANALFARAAWFGTAIYRGPPRRPPSTHSHPPADHSGASDAQVIEGEFKRIDERTVDPGRRP